jgi:Plasmid pRiA4b ORF-3-like protein
MQLAHGNYLIDSRIGDSGMGRTKVQAEVPVQVYQLKVTLREVRPPVWRRFQVRSDMTLEQLHWALQLIIGWTNSHLHQFRVVGAA